MSSPSYITKLRERLGAWREARRLIAGWRRASAAAAPVERAKGAVKRAVIIPSDPWTLVGAKGDEAMMKSVVDQLKTAQPSLQVGVVTATAGATAAAGALGFEALPVWANSGFQTMLDGIMAYKPDAVFVLGADVLDGYYHPGTAVRLIAVADLCARRGIHAVLLGFSFNEKPAGAVVEVFNGVSPALIVNLRDATSLRRFQSAIRTQARLVADSAFMLQPDGQHPVIAAAGQWAEQRRMAGATVLGFNIHPMLIKGHTPDDVRRLVGSAVSALTKLMQQHAVDVALISHDYRGTDGDDACLAPINLALSASFKGRIFYPTEQLSAAQLKALGGLMDGVVTGRMHLAIASLGMGVPVAALTYQDKFQGLFDHFEFPHVFLMPPQQAQDPETLFAMLDQFLTEMPRLKSLVDAHLPKVKALSQGNLAGVL